MLDGFSGLALRTKVALGFALLIALALASDIVALLSHRQALQAMDAYFERDARIAGATHETSEAVLKARRHEKDFLLEAREHTGEAAESRYVMLFDGELADVHRNMAVIRSLTIDPDIVEQTLAVERQVAAYEAGFHRVVDLYRKPGHVANDAAIEAASVEYLTAARAMELMLNRLHARVGEAAETTRSTMARLGRRAAWTAGAAGVAALLLGLAVALRISRGIDGALRECVAFAGRLAAGDLAARLKRAGRTESGVLAGSLNRMADALEKAKTQQEEQAGELLRLNRALRVVSQCSESLVRSTSEAELIQAICEHVVNTGGYRLAWVGFALQDAACSIKLAAHAGTDRDYVEQLRLSWGETATGRRGIGGTAVRERRPSLVREISTDPLFAPWRGEALGRGFASCIALPLLTKTGVLGMLSIYSDETDAFDTEEVRVLQELADDLAYGIASLRESNECRRIELELERQANFDTLTGLANRFTLEARLQQSVADVRRHGNKLALMVVDLDRFKMVNDTLGHAVGDALLSEVARMLTRTVRESDTVARLGGDEFIVLVKDVEAMSDVAAVAAKIMATLGAPLRVAGHELRLSVSIGVSLFPDDANDVNVVMRHADVAMHHAKSLGGGHFRFFAPDMNARMAERFAMEADLRRALERDELRVHYQPQVSLASGVITGAEALVRWQHPDKGMVSPAQFIPLAEETGLIVPLGTWVIRSVCKQLRHWLDEGLPVPPVAVNLSARQFRQPDLVSVIERALADHGVEPGLLSLELTESAVMHDVDAAVATMTQLRAIGVRLSLDDFGTGYSSLSHLKRFPIDHLKIDQSFVRDITLDPDSTVICDSIIGLAHSLKMTVIAEGVETEAQMSYLWRQRCDEMQGYLFSRPVAAADFAALLQRDRRLALPAAGSEQRAGALEWSC